jgi:hypothetical protein
MGIFMLAMLLPYVRIIWIKTRQNSIGAISAASATNEDQ